MSGGKNGDVNDLLEFKAGRQHYPTANVGWIIQPCDVGRIACMGGDGYSVRGARMSGITRYQTNQATTRIMRCDDCFKNAQGSNNITC